MSELVGRRLGKYAVERELGRGGMAVVYAARDETLGRDVALKVIRAELLVDRDFLQRFRQEARAAAHLSHPNIVPIYELDEVDGRLFFVTPIVGGGTLAERLRAGPLPPEQALRVARQLASALDYAHGRNVVHRDVKPANVLLDGDGNALLTDFGVAKLLEAETGGTMAGTVIGTPAYMAPEQLEGRKVDGRADLYSLAAIVFEMLSGRPPFRGETLIATLRAQADPVRPALSEVLPEVDAETDRAMARALAVAPEARYASGAEMVDAVFASHARSPGAPASARTGDGRPGRSVGAADVSGHAPAARANAPARMWLAALLAFAGIGAGLLFLVTGSVPGDPAAQPGLLARVPRAAWLVIALALGALALGVGGVSSRRTAAPAHRDPSRDAPIVDGADAPRTAGREARADQGAEPGDPAGESRPAPAPPDFASPPPPPPAVEPDWGGTIVQPPPSDTVVRAAARATGDDATRIIPPAGAALRAALVVTRCAEQARIGTKVVIDTFPFTIGRDAEADLAITADRGLSRRHAVIERADGPFQIRDAGSTNGVYVNGRLVPRQACVRLFFNDSIRLSGETTLTFAAAETTRPPEMSGQVVDGRYRLAELLHASEKAAIYAAEDLSLPRRVAVKVFSPALAALPDYRMQFEREARIAAGLRHPHIRKILGYGETDCASGDGERVRATYLCMELMDGGSLAERLQRPEPPPASDAVQWIARIADALDHAHAQGVVHAGVKPSAVVFDAAGNPCLSDFAIAARPDDATAASADAADGPLIGSPAFLAPEQWDGAAPTPAVDQYALAVLAYVTLAGARPYEGQEDPEVRARNFRSGPPPAHQEAARHGRKDLPPAASRVLARALATDPAARYPSAGEFARALARAVAGRHDGEPSVFLSYQREASAGWATLIARDLVQQHGITTFLDTQRVDAVGRFPERLKRAIEHCDVFVCLLAADTLSSGWVREEIRLAAEHGKPMVPVFQESFDPARLADEQPAHVEELLRYDGVHLLDRRNIHIEHTLSELARLVGRSVRRD